MSRRNKAKLRAVADLEAAVIHLTRAAQRLQYLDDYLSPSGDKAAAQLWERVSDSLATASVMLEDETIDDAVAKRRVRR